MNNKHSVILLITLCISKSQIVVHGPPFRFTEDFWWSMEKLAGIMRRAPPLCCKLLRQVPMFFIITKDWRPLKAAGSFKKNKTKTKQNPRACCHHYESREHKSADQQRHQLPAEIFFLHAGFPSFVTFAQLNSRQVCTARVSQLRGKLCQQSITCQQPKAHFCVSSELMEMQMPREAKPHCKGSSSCARRTTLAWALCPKLLSPGVCFHTAQSVGRETERTRIPYSLTALLICS